MADPYRVTASLVDMPSVAAEVTPALIGAALAATAALGVCLIVQIGPDRIKCSAAART
jgi:hypothetical protein